MSYPENLKYTKQHEWIRVEGEYAFTGITEHAVHELGDIVHVDLPKVGASFAKGEALGSVESVKAVSDIYAAVSGEVLEANAPLAQTPEKLNEDPHGAAWLVKLKLTSPAELNDLLDSAAYQSYIGAE